LTILLKNGLIVNTDSVKKGDIIINEGKITSIIYNEKKSTIPVDSNTFSEIIDCSGKYILPGIIDTHVHLRDLNQKNKETIKSGTLAALHGGITSLLAMPNTNPPLSNTDMVIKYQKIIQTDANCKVYVIAGLNEGFTIEEIQKLQKLNVKGLKIYPGGSPSAFPLNWSVLLEAERVLRDLFTNDNIHYEDLSRQFDNFVGEKKAFLQNETNLMNWMRLFFESAKYGIALLFHPDTPINTDERKEKFLNLIKCDISYLEAHSNTFTKLQELLHLLYIFKLVELFQTTEYMKEFNQKNYNLTIEFCHVSCGESVELIHFLQNKLLSKKSSKLYSKRSLEIRIEVTPHHLFLNFEMFPNDYISNIKGIKPEFAKVLCPLRRRADNLELQRLLKEGKISFIGTDHAPHSIEDKSQDFYSVPSGFPGLDTYVLFTLTYIMGNNPMFPSATINLSDFVKYSAQNPSVMFDLKNKGQLKIGYDADITIIEKTNPYKLTENQLYTSAKFSPYLSLPFSLKISHVFLMGKHLIGKSG
jgi:dihydroorotase